VFYRHWKEIEADMPCPIMFTDEEYQEHYRNGEGWDDIADFWDSLEGLVTIVYWKLVCIRSFNWYVSLGAATAYTIRGFALLLGKSLLNTPRKWLWRHRLE
jgi:hypothetical protein